MSAQPVLPPGPPEHHVVLPGQAPDGAPILSVLAQAQLSHRRECSGCSSWIAHDLWFLVIGISTTR